MDFQTELDDLQTLKTFFDDLEKLLIELRNSFEQPENEQIDHEENVTDIDVGVQNGRGRRGRRVRGRLGFGRLPRGLVAVPTNQFVRIRCHVNPIRRFMYRRIFRIQAEL